MSGLLYKIRSRPLKERQRIVYGSAFVVTLVVCGVWLTLLYFDSHKNQNTASTDDRFAPLKSLSSGISNMWSNAKYSVPKNEPAGTEQTPTQEAELVPSTSEMDTRDESVETVGGQVILTPQPTETPSSTPNNE